MCMWKRDRKINKKKGVTLIELIIALSIFIILAIPITNGVMQNIKANKMADETKDKSMAINYGYENLRKIVEDKSIKLDKETYPIVDNNGRSLEYKGKFTKFIYKYKVKDIENYTTQEGVTGPIGGANTDPINKTEFSSNIIKVELEVLNESGSSLIQSEEYTFKTNISTSP